MLCLLVCSAAEAGNNDTILFPPLRCTSSTPFISWDGQPGQTMCKTGQDVMKNALPTCTADQGVVYDGSKFYCKSPVTVPTCESDEFLSFDGTNYVCKSTGIPACGANEVLTFNGTKFYCVRRTDQIPTCGANQFLTYNGTTFQCANAPQPSNTVPIGSLCGMATGTSAVEGESTPSGCYLVTDCQGHDPCSSCPSGYTSTRSMPNGPPANASALTTCVKN